jgi:tetratricopeptide (TPR) repeat protein/TolB-like protein
MLVAVLLGTLLAILVGSWEAEAKTRPVLIMPFQNQTPGETDGWLGEGIAETLYAGLQVSGVALPIDRSRIAKVRGSDASSGAPDRAAMATLARTLRAELVLFGEYRRTDDGGITITPRALDLVKGGEPQTLDPVNGAAGKVLDAQAELVSVYARGLKLGLAPDVIQRMVVAARPTSNLVAFEAFTKGRRSALRGTQEGHEGAAELLARAVEVDPTFALAHYHLGLAHLALQNRWKAAAQFRAATQVDASLPEPFKALGDLFMSSPRRLYDQAIEAYQRSLTIRPHYAEAHVGLGDAKAAKGDHEGAIGHYQKALALDPLNARVHFSLAKIYYNEKGLYFEAVNAYKKAIELDQYLVDARMGLGETYEEKGLYKDAIAEYRKVIEVDGKHTGAHYNLALAYEKVDPKEAMVQWERYIELASQIASEKEWVDVARQHLRKLRDKNPQ